MAVGVMAELKDFINQVTKAKADRYELWVTNTEIALMPIVTSKNVHTYFYRYKSKEELDSIKEAFKGRIIQMEDVLLDKW